MSASVKQKLTVLGATGTIGVNTLDVVARHPDAFEVVALTGNGQVERLSQQCVQFNPRYAVVLQESAAEQLRSLLRETGCQTEVLCGVEALEFVSALPEVDSVMAAIVGAAGLRPSLAAAQAGKRVLLANKETLVMSGRLFMDAVHHNGAVLLPIDSEHNAIFQALPRDYNGDMQRAGVSKILLTASGGPFRRTPVEDLKQVTPEQACAHPNWVMGRKISVDSATMMNKGLEVIEAHWLFNVPGKDIQVVIHPQSVIHSLVQYVDGSVLAELGNPDMRTPIAYALGYPERIDAGVGQLDLFKVAQLNFEEPDLDRFPSLRLAFEALERGGSAPAILNAANEVAVAAFLDRRLAFTDIARLNEEVLQTVSVNAAATLEEVIAADQVARATAQNWLERRGMQAA